MNHKISYRLLDILLSTIGLFLCWPILVIVWCIGWFDTKQPVFLQTRVGRNGEAFTLIKFRTMVVNTESVATHLVDTSSVTTLGAVLRKTKLDELPQLINVLRGEMSFVGPRPCLPNQLEVIEARCKYGVYDVLPGITGLSQINHIDMSKPDLLAKTDANMMKKLTIKTYFELIIATVSGKGRGDKIREKE